MKKLELQIYPQPILIKKTTKIKNPLDPEIQELILCMIETMREKNGVGLAAPQVGSNHRLCVIEEDNVIYVLINPTITSTSKEKIISEEGCLSFPNEFFPIKRYAKVQVRYLDKNGNSAKIKASGLLSRALQHEIDHLDGILIIDRLQKKSAAKAKKNNA